MREFKYVIVAKAYPFIFSVATNHSDLNNLNITSAGFGRLHTENGKLVVKTFGRSTKMEFLGNYHII